ncbi:hypothetical protein OEG84_09410 [Hoeflea sp. G2-23]|uniref:Uncharacterized protein n=1 Tax=Hoeflea algicola TaxID=2983763 RepID=A0ABT3Z9I1_9HYPH|nr:hypothetical protein [Hoeflea algicola]MCY0147921.1 hypothetical protein [Hoeflea algicola]
MSVTQNGEPEKTPLKEKTSSIKIQKDACSSLPSIDCPNRRQTKEPGLNFPDPFADCRFSSLQRHIGENTGTFGDGDKTSAANEANPMVMAPDVNTESHGEGSLLGLQQSGVVAGSHQLQPVSRLGKIVTGAKHPSTCPRCDGGRQILQNRKCTSCSGTGDRNG